MTRLVRNLYSGGSRIHLATCRHARTVVPWNWAEGRPDEEWMALGWFKPCRACLPDQAKLQDELKARVTP